MNYAVVFPGQGSQAVNMFAEFREEYESEVAETYAEASEVLGYDLEALVRDNPDDKLNQTEYTQPALLTVGVIAWRIWQEQGVTDPLMLAGHSLGEYSSLVAADVISFADAVALVAERGRLMQQAVPAGEGSMAAILGLDDSVIQDICTEAAQGGVVEAVNFNSPGQVVIAGDHQAVERAIALASSSGAKRAIALSVSVPSHSSLMVPAAEKLAEIMATIKFAPPKIPVLHNIDAQMREEPAAIIDALRHQLHNPVRWVDTVQLMAKQGTELILEFGPGKVLAGLCRRIDRNLKAIAMDSPAGLQKAIDAIEDLSE
jgi:[acyl-carrier-protein] S-malonyltransferase